MCVHAFGCGWGEEGCGGRYFLRERLFVRRREAEGKDGRRGEERQGDHTTEPHQPELDYLLLCSIVNVMPEVDSI